MTAPRKTRKQPANKVNGRAFEKQHLTLKSVKPLTKNQEHVFSSDKHQVLNGSAGTGKTFISSALAYKAVLRGEYSKIVYVRSAVATRSLGHYPGTLEEKAAEYEAPYINIASELFGRDDAYGLLKAAGQVQFITTSHVRGITLRNAIVIVDEVQNMTYHELDSVMTRPDDGCKMFFCGDYAQSDIRDSGIREFWKVLKAMEEFNFVTFEEEDIVRSGLVKSYLMTKARLKNESCTK